MLFVHGLSCICLSKHILFLLCFLCLLLTVLCFFLCLCVVMCLLLAIWLLTKQVNKEVCIEINYYTCYCSTDIVQDKISCRNLQRLYCHLTCIPLIAKRNRLIYNNYLLAVMKPCDGQKVYAAAVLLFFLLKLFGFKFHTARRYSLSCIT